MPRRALSRARRIVVKLGTALLTNDLNGVDSRLIGRIATQAAELRRRGIDVVIVSSGAIGTGWKRLGLAKPPGDMPGKQAAASVGQTELMSAYARIFRNRGLVASQVLLTRDDFLDRRRYTNLLNVFDRLLRLGAVPIVNENDSVAVDEIRLGDNDTISALVSMLVGADALIILTVVEGLYSGGPDGEGRRILSNISRVDDSVRKHVHRGVSSGGSGGMATKLEAARMVTSAGLSCVIAGGRTPNVLLRLLAGEEIGTAFLPGPKRLVGKRRWLAFAGEARGAVTVDEGAKKAVLAGKKSLLPAGVRSVEGEFREGDIILVKDPAGKVFAKGITNFSHSELARMAGRHSSEALSRRNGPRGGEVIHRDNMVAGEDFFD